MITELQAASRNYQRALEDQEIILHFGYEVPVSVLLRIVETRTVLTKLILSVLKPSPAPFDPSSSSESIPFP